MKKIVFTIVALWILAFHAQAQRVALRPGEYLSNIALKSTGGQMYDFKSQRVKGFIVVFMTPSCDHCIAYEQRVMALDAKYKLKGYPVVAIGPYADYPNEYPLDAFDAMKKLAAKGKFTFPYLGDDQFKYTTLLGIGKTPTAVILEKKPNGLLIKYIGDIDNQPDPKKAPTLKFVENELKKLVK